MKLSSLALCAGFVREKPAMFRLLRRLKHKILNLLRIPDALRGMQERLVELRDSLDALDERLRNYEREAEPSASGKLEELSFHPLTDIPFPKVDTSCEDPVEEILQSPTFRDTERFFETSPSASRALVSPTSQAILYSLVRILKPNLVVEVGTYKAATTEALARAVERNKVGLVETIDPYGFKQGRPIIAAWPLELRSITRFRPINSMEYFAELHAREKKAGLFFIDGNHDFEFALFDIESAARFLHPRGFLVIDNISQPGPYMATREFLMRHRGWRESGNPITFVNRRAPFDANRVKIHNTDFCILRAPHYIRLTERPMTLGQVPFFDSFAGVQIELAQPLAGTLHVQCVVRTFGTTPTETIIANKTEIDGDDHVVRVPLHPALDCAPDVRRSAELWLTWEGNEDLRLISTPTIF